MSDDIRSRRDIVGGFGIGLASSFFSRPSSAAASQSEYNRLNTQCFRVSTFSEIAGTRIPPNYSVVCTAGWSVVGRGGGVYVEVSGGEVKRYRAISLDGRWFELVDNVVAPEQFGAIGDGVSDDAPAFAAAFEYLVRGGGGCLHLGARNYLFGRKLVYPPNVHLRGQGINVSILRLGADTGLFGRHGSRRTGSISMCDLSISGYADRNPELGDTKLVDVGPFDSAIFDRIEVSSSRNMALACVARYGTVSNSLFFRNLRDAINFTGSSRFHAEGNVIEECGDDAIACHIPRGTIGVYDSEVRIANNHIRKSFGIKVLGARNAAIVGNTLRLWYGYAIHIGSDANFEEGLAPKFGVTISGNSIIDGINSLLVGNVDRGAAIFISGSQGLGRGEDTISEYEDDSFFKYINRVGAEAGVPPSVGIMIIGNTMLQNWGDGGQFSEYGFGLLFTNKGYVNPHIPRRGGETSGVHITADTICVNLSSNIATGFTKGVSLSPSARLQDFAICGNSIVQCENGVVIDPQSRRLGGTVFSSGNNYNIDPFRVLASRVQDGSWSELGDKEGVAILIRGFDGFFSQGDSFQNCKTVIRSGGRASVVDARYIYDWSDGFKGLGEQPNLLSGRHFFAAMPIVGGDQLSYSSFDDSGFVLGANQMPQRGYFVEGQMIRSINRGEGSRRVLGWLRLTTGEAHQLGVDWAVISRE